MQNVRWNSRVSVFPSSNRTPTDSERGSQLVVRPPDDLASAPISSVVAPEERTAPWTHPEWQRLWLATQRAEWRSLALVPAGAMPPRFTLEIALALAYTGSLHLGEPIRMADATSVPLTHLKQFVGELEALRRAGDRLVVALGPVRDSATAVAIAQSADQALLCVPLEVSKVADAKRTISEVGQRRFLGSAVFRV